MYDDDDDASTWRLSRCKTLIGQLKLKFTTKKSVSKEQIGVIGYNHQDNIFGENFFSTLMKAFFLSEAGLNLASALVTSCCSRQTA